jgi:diguanylate cyclase
MRRMQSNVHDCANPELQELLADVLAGDPAAAGFEVYYQPIVRLADGATVALEALARWQHPVAGCIEPSMFVTAAERGGLMGVLDDFVLDRACADADALAEAHGDEVGVHVNISAIRLGRPDLDAAVAWVLRKHRLPARRLTLEITETTRIEDLTAAAAAVQRLRARGVRVALDDLGSEFNTLARLRALPVDLVKLDAALTGAAAGSWNTEEQCRSLVAACHQMRMRMVAEGIETARQAIVLQVMGCQLGQGFLFGAPMRLAEATAL